MTTPEDPRQAPERATSLFLAVVLGVALIGFFSGTSPSEYVRPDPEPPPDAHANEDIPEAPTYAMLRDHPRQAANGFEADIAQLAALGWTSPGTREEALAARAARRAYDGAPPTIPHPIRQDAAPECLTCHDDGMQLRGHHAVPMSHREMTSCTQCHVVSQPPMPGAGLPPDPRAVPNGFVGMASPEAGPRAWSIAPPQIPHRTWLRERCDSCHGENGRNGMQTPHPYRDSCTQCHTAPAEVDMRPGVPR